MRNYNERRGRGGKAKDSIGIAMKPARFRRYRRLLVFLQRSRITLTGGRQRRPRLISRWTERGAFRRRDRARSRGWADPPISEAIKSISNRYAVERGLAFARPTGKRTSEPPCLGHASPRRAEARALTLSCREIRLCALTREILARFHRKDGRSRALGHDFSFFREKKILPRAARARGRDNVERVPNEFRIAAARHARHSAEPRAIDTPAESFADFETTRRKRKRLAQKKRKDERVSRVCERTR